LRPRSRTPARIPMVPEAVLLRRIGVLRPDPAPDLPVTAQMSVTGSGADGDTLLLENLLQFAGLVHLADDIATAEELALDVKLRNRRPV
jgi:hypothetical protein